MTIPSPRICIATYSNPRYKDICALTLPNKLAYARRWNHDCLNFCPEVDYSKVFFNRHKWYLELMAEDRWDWILATDADLIFTNLTIPLESFTDSEHSIVLCRDAHGLQAGMILFRCNPISRSFLEHVIDQAHRFKPGVFNDQEAMEELLPQFQKNIKILPQWQWQSYDYALYKDLGGNYVAGLDADGNRGQWQPGDFAFHVPACQDRKIEILQKHLQMVQR